MHVEREEKNIRIIIYIVTFIDILLIFLLFIHF